MMLVLSFYLYITYTNSLHANSTPFLHERLVRSIQAGFFGRGTELSLATAYHTHDIVMSTCNGALVSWVCSVMHDKIAHRGRSGGSGTFEMARGIGKVVLYSFLFLFFLSGN
jgi:hypothetical protein